MTTARRILAKAPRHERVRAYAFASKAAPAEIQLWNVGDNATDYGVHEWTERSQREVMARYTERGNPLVIDVEHNGSSVEGEPATTGGYARLELRDGAPWLIFDWSAYALEQIATRQRLFLSPEYDVDPDTNEITKVYRVSLVADPGTYRARVLASAAFTSAKERGVHMDPTLLAIMALLDSVPDPAAAIDAVRGFVAAMPGSDAPTDAPVDDAVVADAPKSEDKPAFAASASDDKPVAAAAPVATAIAAAAPAAPVAPPPPPIAASAAEGGSVKAARDYALQSENALRDSILLRDGHRLAPSVRVWASSQSLNVVRGLCGAAPEVATPPSRVAATRGATQGAGPTKARGLEGAELDEFRRGSTMYRASAAQPPHKKPNGEFVFPIVPPRDVERVKASAAKGGAK